MIAEAPDGTTKSDVRLEGRALRQRWALSDDDRKRLLERQVRLALDPDVPDRVANTASKNVLDMDKINLEAERLELDRAKFERDSKADSQPAAFVVPDVDKIGEEPDAGI